MTRYTEGRAVEYAVIYALTRDGYWCIRAAASKGTVDVVAVKPGQVLFVNVKKGEKKPPTPAERAAVLALSSRLPGVAVPLVALGPASRLTFRLLTGPGPDQWVPWVADELESVTP